MVPFPRRVIATGRRRHGWTVAAILVLWGCLMVSYIGNHDDALERTTPEKAASSNTAASSDAIPSGDSLALAPAPAPSSPPAGPESNPKTGEKTAGAIIASSATGAGAVAPEKPERVAARREMVERQLRRRGIENARVLDAMDKVPRHRFVAEHLQAEAYDDHPLPIGRGQTISQPYVVALMTELAAPKPGERALDVGTGSGYQAAVLSELCKEVYGIEIVAPLAEQAKKRLADLGYANVTVRAGDGYRGWPEHAPFDVIILAAAPDHVPPALVEQLAKGGRLVLPVGGEPQQLMLVEKLSDGTIRRRATIPVMFVPMTGEAQQAK